jgi:hypothetical protein
MLKLLQMYLLELSICQILWRQSFLYICCDVLCELNNELLFDSDVYEPGHCFNNVPDYNYRTLEILSHASNFNQIKKFFEATKTTKSSDKAEHKAVFLHLLRVCKFAGVIDAIFEVSKKLV